MGLSQLRRLHAGREGPAGVVVLTNHNEDIDALGFGLLRVLPKEIALTAEALGGFVGEYRASPKFAFTVSVKDGALFLQATGQGKLALFASAPDEFFLKGVAARIGFTRDATGKISGLTLHQNGRDTPAKRGE